MSKGNTAVEQSVELRSISPVSKVEAGFQDHDRTPSLQSVPIEAPRSQAHVNDVPASVAVEGRYLHARAHETISRFSLDFVLLVVPVLFIALAGVAAHIDGREVSNTGRHVESASKLGPTIYPMVFAAIAGRFMKHLARWKAEKGERLGILEQLVNSQSLAGAITSAVFLQNLSITSAAITLLWILSPIGGQSSLRLVSFTEAAKYSENSIYSPVAGTTHWFGGLVHFDDVQGGVNALISASLLAPTDTQNAPTDTWGNPKIPVLDYIAALPRNDSENGNSSVWQDMSKITEQIKYSSLVGVPLWDVPKKGRAEFSLRWPITSTDCKWHGHSYTAEEWCDFSNYWYNTPASTSYNGGLCTYNETSKSTKGYMLSGGSVLSSNYLLSANLNPVKTSNASQLHSDSPPHYVDVNYTIYDPQPRSSGSKEYNYGAGGSCELRTIHADVEISCSDGKCNVARMRRSNDTRPDFLNVWNDASVFPDDLSLTKLGLLGVILKQLPRTTGYSYSVHYASAFDTFLNGVDQPFAQGGAPTTLDWSNVDSQKFSERFAQLYNSFYIAAQWPVDVSDKTQKNISMMRDDSGKLPQEYQESVAFVTEKHKAYQANYVWITLLVLVSIVLFFCALASLVLRYIVVAPDLLGFVSSLTRDNVHFPFDLRGGSALDGEDRARVLRDVRVQVADVRPNEEMGHIAFTFLENVDAGVTTGTNVPQRVRKRRLYD